MKVYITLNNRGGYSIVTPAKELGNYATRKDAVRVAVTNGWTISYPNR